MGFLVVHHEYYIAGPTLAMSTDFSKPDFMPCLVDVEPNFIKTGHESKHWRIYRGP